MTKASPPERYDFLWRVFADKQLSPSAKCAATVLLLQYRNNRTGLCNPAYASLAKAMGSTRRGRGTRPGTMMPLFVQSWSGSLR
jgi:hypothetical protein